jgi:hypothetical protein
MDLTGANFAESLPWVLNQISSSCFVAMDLEMSGIPLSVKHQGLKTLQKHYEDNKAAAEKYQILQVGLTICHEDKESGNVNCLVYILFVCKLMTPNRELCAQTLQHLPEPVSGPQSQR